MAFHYQYVSIEQPAISQLIRELRQTLKLTQEKFIEMLLNPLSESADAKVRERH
ncbi:hypothetical protein H6G76_21960 [Nostoc sp. FACHB-152]|uniref:hypothetical protein n=1 Tax=unclassified Nostoc TaxID=2593658 RepID=UPI001687CDF7|nr:MULTISPECIES: hypothetical protein [unclassified Nostoc]MBD2449782.1 hypothetical protein [Nostoc sp. FACHB-152]MBD2471130.1 hypothetical protein [Nostoc sp. FACHB-145]